MTRLPIWAAGLFLAFAHATSSAEIWECIEQKTGNKLFTADSQEAKERGCSKVDLSPKPIVSPPQKKTIVAPKPSMPFRNWDAPSVAFVKKRSGQSLTGEELYKQLANSVYELRAYAPSHLKSGSTKLSYGSAVAVTQRFALTNCHVVENESNVIVLADKDGRQLRGRVVGANPNYDRCIIESISGELIPIVGIRSFDSLNEGERVYAMGNPRGLTRTLSDGLLSAKRVGKAARIVQTTAPISPGSSGGGLFDSVGNLIGITTLTFRESQNINLAIPAEDYWIAHDSENSSVGRKIVLSEKDVVRIGASIMSGMKSVKDPDAIVPYVAFDTEAEARRWLAAMSKHIASRMPDTAKREEFLVTAHYEAKRAGLDPQLVLALIEVLSNFQKNMVSNQDARGYMQVRDEWRGKLGREGDNLSHLRTNLKYGCEILRAYLDLTQGDLFRALVAYREDSDPTARRDSAAFPGSVVRNWQSRWQYQQSR